VRKLQRKRGPRRALLKNQATSLILYEKIKTTQEKAKEVRSLVERLIHKSKKGDLAALRYLRKFLPKNAAKKVIEDLAPAYKDQKSGYLRILKLGKRKGDAAQMVMIEFIERKVPQKTQKKPDNTG
jgi:large subunit ribosomal protein L17